jgi:hypothetical protein
MALIESENEHLCKLIIYESFFFPHESAGCGGGDGGGG